MGKIANLFREQRISLPEQQKAAMLALDREFVEMEAKIKVLEAEKLHLQAKVNPLEREVEGLKNHIKQNATRDQHKLRPKEEEEILLLLFKGPMDESEVINAIGKGAEETRFNLVELADAGLIEHKSEYHMPVHCSLTQSGRRYLKDRTKGDLAGG